jgi:hypothetical protein
LLGKIRYLAMIHDWHQVQSGLTFVLWERDIYYYCTDNLLAAL